MSLPGFSAEASLQKPRKPYRTVSPGRSATPILSQAVLPQALCCQGGTCWMCQSVEVLVDDEFLSTGGTMRLQIPPRARLF